MSKLEQVRTSEADPDRKCCCNCKRKLDPYQLFDANVEDIARSLSQIMILCGINTNKACNAKSIIKRAFIYHEKLRTCCPSSPPANTHLHKNDLLQALRLKCEMEKVEATLTYAIIKRAFKAFFHGKPEMSISNPIMDAMSVHDQKAAWLHAAYKTARIFDSYRSAFFWAHKFYEKQINVVYRSLYERMSARANPLTVPNCPCPKCANREVPGHVKPGQRVHEKLKLADCADLPQACLLCGLQVPKIITNMNTKMKRPRPILNHALNIPRCSKCNSPTLICECYIDQLTGEFFGECGQDSYKVKWYRVETDPAKAVPERGSDSLSVYEDAMEHDWENHHCPLDCLHDSLSESSNVCHEKKPTSSSVEEDSSINSCSNANSDDIVEKLEEYLNQLWAEDVAAKKTPDTYKRGTVQPPRSPCEACNR